MSASFDYIRSYYKVPAKRGGRVRFEGKPGTIVWADGPYLRIRIDGERGVRSYHPLWHIEYQQARAAVLATAEGGEGAD